MNPLTGASLAVGPHTQPEVVDCEPLPVESAADVLHKAQRYFFSLEQFNPQHAAQRIVGRWRIDGEFSSANLKHAWEIIGKRHEALRTRFDVAHSEPHPIAEPHAFLELKFYDLRGTAENEAHLEAERLALRDCRATMDLSAAPLLNISLIKESERRSLLAISAHRIILDRWSLEIIVRELVQICALLQRGETIPAAESSSTGLTKTIDAHLHLESPEQVTSLKSDIRQDHKRFELATDYPRTAIRTSNCSVSSVEIASATMSALADIAKSSGGTTVSAVLAAVFLLLHRYSGESDILIGTRISGRNRVEFESIIGCLVKVSVYRANLAGDPTFRELVARMQAIDTIDLGSALVRAGTPDNLDRSAGQHPDYAIRLTVERSAFRQISTDRFSVVSLGSKPADLDVDLHFIITERSDGWDCACEYNTDLYDDDSARGLVRSLKTILYSLVTDADQRISRVQLLSDAQRDRLIVTLNETQARYPAEQTVAQQISARAKQTPAAIAVVCGDKALTYAELDAFSNRLARELIRRGLGPAKRVGVLLERSVDLVVSLLAVLKAGSAYVPFDPQYPSERLTYIISNSRLAAVISRSNLTQSITIADTPLLNLDTAQSAIALNNAGPLATSAPVDGPAYIIYTSGSTGRPKGVSIGHRSLVNVLCAVSAANAFNISTSDVHVAVATVSFDIATLELFLPLINGARLVVATESEVSDSYALHRLLQTSGATFMQGTPITWELLMDAGWVGDPRLTILCGGEAISRRLANQLLERGNILWNGYGPTEAAIVSSIARVERGPGPVLIGPPIANTQLYILDSNMQLVPESVAGELYIGGDGVATGYFDRPDLTQERFVHDPFGVVPGAKLYRTGDIMRRRGPDSFEFLGRSDEQIKVRGFRIELGEIEANLLRLPDIKEAVVVIRGEAAADKTIWAFVVAKMRLEEPRDAWTAVVRTQLSGSLPQYMLPSLIVALDALPRTPNGKIDRQALPRVAGVSADKTIDAPLTVAEKTLAVIISELLGRESVGRYDNIFELGFHSLLAIRLVDQIAIATGIRMPLHTIYDTPSIAQLAGRLSTSGQKAPAFNDPKPIVTLNPHGSRPPFWYFHNDLLTDGMYCRRLAAAIGSAQPVHAIAPHGTAGLHVEYSIENMAKDYLPRIRNVQPLGPYRLGGFCAGGLVAYEIAQQLKAQGESVERLVLINALPLSGSRGTDLLIRLIAANRALPARLRQKFCFNMALLSEALAQGPQGLISFVSRRARTYYERARRGVRMERSISVNSPPQRDVLEASIAQAVAPLTYHPQKYDSELTLFWSTDQALEPGDAFVRWSNGDAYHRWRQLAKTIQFMETAGDHFSPVQSGVDELGTALSGVLR